MNLTWLSTCNVGKVRFQEPLSRHCTYAIGGMAAAIVEPASISDLQTLRQIISRHDLSWTVLGSGSNLLCPDNGFDGIVIKIGPQMATFNLKNSRIQADAGFSAARLATRSALAGLSGLGHIVGIPGSLGGLIAMNGGSNGHSVSQHLTHVETIDDSGQLQLYPKNQCDFAYRSSRFQRSTEIIVRATFDLPRGNRSQLVDAFRETLQLRRQKFPLLAPNCGSVFISSPTMYSSFGPPGKVIEDTGLKGFRVGGAEVSQRHANFIVNSGQATARDVIALVIKVRERVFQRTGLKMPCELRYLFPDGSIRPLHELLENTDHDH